MKLLCVKSPIGKLTIAESGGFITHIYFEDEAPQTTTQSSPLLRLASIQLKEYFDGKREVFELPIKPNGGEFFQRVWQTMQDKVTFGQLITYGQLASMVGKPKAARAVGMANNRNPIPIIIPCHRVVGANGNLTGFRAGLDVKRKLLQLEGVV